MKTPLMVLAVLLLGFTSCKKAISSLKDTVSARPNFEYVQYSIPKGAHDVSSPYRNITAQALSFAVKFDNSAMYQTADPANQADINKLYGFSDNKQSHHNSSARIGWRWYNNQLQLFGYVYNNSIQSSQLITAVSLNQEINCSIAVDGIQYLFTVNDARITMPRAAGTNRAEGYLLYPYFGGTEVAPQDITIQIKDLP